MYILKNSNYLFNDFFLVFTYLFFRKIYVDFNFFISLLIYYYFLMLVFFYSLLPLVYFPIYFIHLFFNKSFKSEFSKNFNIHNFSNLFDFVRCCYFVALVVNYFYLTKRSVTFLYEKQLLRDSLVSGGVSFQIVYQTLVLQHILWHKFCFCSYLSKSRITNVP